MSCRGFPIPDFLIAGGLSDQRNNANYCESLNHRYALFGDMYLPIVQRPSVVGLYENLASEGEHFSPESKRVGFVLWAAKPEFDGN